MSGCTHRRPRPRWTGKVRWKKLRRGAGAARFHGEEDGQGRVPETNAFLNRFFVVSVYQCAFIHAGVQLQRRPDTRAESDDGELQIPQGNPQMPQEPGAGLSPYLV